MMIKITNSSTTIEVSTKTSLPKPFSKPLTKRQQKAKERARFFRERKKLKITSPLPSLLFYYLLHSLWHYYRLSTFTKYKDYFASPIYDLLLMLIFILAVIVKYRTSDRYSIEKRLINCLLKGISQDSRRSLFWLKLLFYCYKQIRVSFVKDAHKLFYLKGKKPRLSKVIKEYLIAHPRRPLKKHRVIRSFWAIYLSLANVAFSLRRRGEALSIFWVPALLLRELRGFQSSPFFSLKAFSFLSKKFKKRWKEKIRAKQLLTAQRLALSPTIKVRIKPTKNKILVQPCASSLIPKVTIRYYSHATLVPYLPFWLFQYFYLLFVFSTTFLALSWINLYSLATVQEKVSMLHLVINFATNITLFQRNYHFRTTSFLYNKFVYDSYFFIANPGLSMNDSDRRRKVRRSLWFVRKRPWKRYSKKVFQGYKSASADTFYRKQLFLSFDYSYSKKFSFPSSVYFSSIRGLRRKL